MTTDPRYRSLLTLFGLAVACTLISASRWLAGGLAPFWAICCQALGRAVGGEIKLWMPYFEYIAAISLLLFGLSVFLRRLWITHRFVSGLKGAIVGSPPARLARLVADLGLGQHVVVLATEAPLAFCFGLLRPRICISTGLADTLTNKELKAVLLHEDHHRRHYDPLRGLLAEVLAKTLFFLPIAAELRDLFLTSNELDADRHAARLVGRPSLAGALHKIITHPHASRLSAPGIAGISATEARIAELLGDRPTELRLSAGSLFTSSVIIMLGCMLVL